MRKRIDRAEDMSIEKGGKGFFGKREECSDR
jgi:hypothetical protein